MTATIRKVIPLIITANIQFLSFEFQFHIFAYNLTYYQVIVNNEPIVNCNSYSEAVHYCEENYITYES